VAASRAISTAGSSGDQTEMKRDGIHGRFAPSSLAPRAASAGHLPWETRAGAARASRWLRGNRSGWRPFGRDCLGRRRARGRKPFPSILARRAADRRARWLGIRTTLDAPIGLAIHAAGSVLIARVEELSGSRSRPALMQVNLIAGLRDCPGTHPGHGVPRVATIGFNLVRLRLSRSALSMGPMAASKAGIERLAEALRIELADSGVRVTGRLARSGRYRTMTSNPPTLPAGGDGQW